MNSEKLAKLRERGFLLDPKYDRLAIIGDKKETKEEGGNEKTLSIKFMSCSADDSNYNLKFEISQTNLKKFDATIFVEEMNATNEIAIPKTKVKLSSNKKTSITVSFSKSKEFDRYLWQSGFVYQATIVCDEITGKTNEFQLKCINNSKNSNITCFCNKNLTTKEFKNIVIELRKKEVLDPNNKMVRDEKGNPILKNGKKQFVDYTSYDAMGEKIFSLDYPEKIRKEDANFEKFTEAINKTFRDYHITTCIRKIHFLAQCYHETQRFDLSYEKNPSSTVSGGSFYRGRGLIQLTHDYNYEKLRKKISNNSKLSDFVPRVAKEINLACQASGYYWKNLGIVHGDINTIADKDDVLTVSKEINGYGGKNGIPNGFNDRKTFTNLLKEIFDYENCKNKK